MTKATDPVYEIIASMQRSSPEKSFKRLNPALRSTLGNCIEADIPFQGDTFHRIFHSLRGSWWFGSGNGSEAGEHFYSLACNVRHSSACQSFEQFADRPPILWEEDAKTPIRLHVGSRFHWKGEYVTVTSLKPDRLVACTYKDADYRQTDCIKVGGVIDDHVVTKAKKSGKGYDLRVVPTKAKSYSREIDRRFTITYKEIEEVRKTAKAKLRALIRKIEQCDPEKDREEIAKEVNAACLRHWEKEEVSAAWSKVIKSKEDASRITAWREGQGGAWFGGNSQIICRVTSAHVETSNGHCVRRAAAEQVIPLLLDLQKAALKTLTPINAPLEGYVIREAGPKGVQIGCTLIPWREVEYVVEQLAK